MEGPGGRAFRLEEGAWILNPSRESVEGYIEKHADCTFKRPLWLLCGRRIYRVGRSGSQESSEGEVVTALVLSQGDVRMRWNEAHACAWQTLRWGPHVTRDLCWGPREAFLGSHDGRSAPEARVWTLEATERVASSLFPAAGRVSRTVMGPNWVPRVWPSVEVELDLLCGAAVSPEASLRSTQGQPSASDSLANTGNVFLLRVMGFLTRGGARSGKITCQGCLRGGAKATPVLSDSDIPECQDLSVDFQKPCSVVASTVPVTPGPWQALVALASVTRGVWPPFCVSPLPAGFGGRASA